VEILKEVVSASSVLLAVVLLVAFGQVLEAVFVDFLSLFHFKSLCGSSIFGPSQRRLARQAAASTTSLARITGCK
jgi:hypothetical protein